MELAVAAAAAGVPPSVGEHQPAAAHVALPAGQRRGSVPPVPGAAERVLPAAAAAGAAALRAHGRPEEGDPGAAAEAEGAEGPEGAHLRRLQTEGEAREGERVRVPGGGRDQEGQGAGPSAAVGSLPAEVPSGRTTLTGVSV